MVAKNPLTTGKWTLKKFNATVLNDIWLEILFFTLVATMVHLISVKRVELGFSNALLTVLGTVLGLVISFRTSSAYERYQDGRKLWTNIAISSRNLAQLIWIHVPTDRPDKADPKIVEDECHKSERLRARRLKAVIEKKSMVNLVQAFSVSVKHFLRGEAGIYYEDLYPIVSFLPRYSVHSSTTPHRHDTLPMWVDHERLTESARSSPAPTPAQTMTKKHKSRKDSFDPEKALPTISSEVPLRGARNPPRATLYDYIPFLVMFKPIVVGVRKLFRRKRRHDDDGRDLLGRKQAPQIADSNIPLEITLFLSSYVQWLLQESYIQPAVATGLVSNLGLLQDTVTNLERVANTPIPFAYQAHLRMSLWLYLFFLPFQIHEAMKYLTIPATAFASFLLLGFLEIGQEIENPFNYDENDLDMDAFCLSIQRELHEITAHPCSHPNAYIFSVHNKPFAPSDQRTAEEMVLDLEHHYHASDTGMTHIRRTLLQNWRLVDEYTRKAQ